MACIILPGRSQVSVLLLCSPAVGQTAARHYVCGVSTFRQNPERLLNPPHRVETPARRCTCQNGQTEAQDFSFILRRRLMFRLKIELSNFHLSVGSRIPRLARGQMLPPALLRWPKAQSAASAPLNRPVWFTILLLTSAISDQPLTPLLTPLHFSRIQLREYSWRTAALPEKKKTEFYTTFISRCLHSTQAANRSEISLIC